jgi:hypothetical protein
MLLAIWRLQFASEALKYKEQIHSKYKEQGFKIQNTRIQNTRKIQGIWVLVFNDSLGCVRLFIFSLLLNLNNTNKKQLLISAELEFFLLHLPYMYNWFENSKSPAVLGN